MPPVARTPPHAAGVHLGVVGRHDHQTVSGEEGEDRVIVQVVGPAGVLKEDHRVAPLVSQGRGVFSVLGRGVVHHRLANEGDVTQHRDTLV